MKRLNRLIGIATVLTMGALANIGTASAQPGSGAQANAQSSNALTNAKASRIVGVWDVTVELLTCNNNPTMLTTFPAMHRFELGGTGQVVPGNAPTIPVHMMVWEYLGDNTYSSVFKFYVFQNATLVGTTVLTNEVWVSEDGMEYGGTGVAEFYDSNGGVLESWAALGS